MTVILKRYLFQIPSTKIPLFYSSIISLLCAVFLFGAPLVILCNYTELKLSHPHLLVYFEEEIAGIVEYAYSLIDFLIIGEHSLFIRLNWQTAPA